MHHPALGRALRVDDAQHVVVGVAVVDDERLVEALGQVDVTPEALLLRRPAVLAGAEGVEPGLADGPHLVVGLRELLDLGERLVEAPASASRGASFGCSATPATRASCAAAASTAQRAPGRSQPICTIRGTPTAAAAARRPPCRASRRRRCRGGSGCRRRGAAAVRGRAVARGRAGRPTSPRWPPGCGSARLRRQRWTTSYTSRLGRPARLATSAIASLRWSRRPRGRRRPRAGCRGRCRAPGLRSSPRRRW